jgi:glycosyltransferase involved in cell wall biosynthesis
MPTISVGVCAHNEEKNIRQSLSSISSQSLKDFKLEEILVVSSGSTDLTDTIVKEYISRDPRVRLIVQEKREGKSSAVNLFMEEAKGNILVLVNADNQLKDMALSRLLAPLMNEKVGIVGGHPVPVNTGKTMVGFAVRMLWDMHHRLSLASPKTGELIAFRNLGIKIPPGTNTDEDWIRMEIERRGYTTAYAPGAIVLNRGPENLKEFMVQRTRVNIGEKYMKKRYGFMVPTWQVRSLIPAISGFLRDNRGHVPKVLGAVSLEFMARIYATVYVSMNRPDQYVWKVVDSTKKLG